ncbi:hypothetical protein [Loktanella sp. S4079]|nr:hypothetical protein [Loktanella sp. S4079]
MQIEGILLWQLLLIGGMIYAAFYLGRSILRSFRDLTSDDTTTERKDSD